VKREVDGIADKLEAASSVLGYLLDNRHVLEQSSSAATKNQRQEGPFDERPQYRYWDAILACFFIDCP
jgi:hypothetical protein